MCPDAGPVGPGCGPSHGMAHAATPPAATAPVYARGPLQPPLPAAAAARRGAARARRRPTARSTAATGARSPAAGATGTTCAGAAAATSGPTCRWRGRRGTTAAVEAARTAPSAAGCAARTPGGCGSTATRRRAARAACDTASGGSVSHGYWVRQVPPRAGHLVPPGRTQGDGAPARHGAGARPPAADEDETVHHRNGDRLDNRPENLELWSTAQPKGQRVEDKLAWAYALLARYDPTRDLPGPATSTARGRPRGCPGRRTTQSRRDWVVTERSPDGIRTHATAVRGRRPRPLDDGAPELPGRARAVVRDHRTGQRTGLAGVPGLEPRLTEPETVGLPITPYPMGPLAEASGRRTLADRRPEPAQRPLLPEQRHRLRQRRADRRAPSRRRAPARRPCRA